MMLRRHFLEAQQERKKTVKPSEAPAPPVKPMEKPKRTRKKTK